MPSEISEANQARMDKWVSSLKRARRVYFVALIASVGALSFSTFLLVGYAGLIAVASAFGVYFFEMRFAMIQSMYSSMTGASQETIAAAFDDQQNTPPKYEPRGFA